MSNSVRLFRFIDTATWTCAQYQQCADLPKEKEKKSMLRCT